MKIFYFQAKNNKVYNTYLKYLNINHTNIKSIYEIPFMPISFFKSQKIVTGHWDESEVFRSSGTSGQQRSSHYVKSLNFYHEVCRKCFESEYGSPDQYSIFALLPSYLERKGSSLIYMVDDFIRSADDSSGFYLNDYKSLIERLEIAKLQGKKIILLGVSFALLELAENFPVDLKGAIIMETGGMKGRRKEMIRSELHEILKNSFKVSSIHSEYGMTELMSQAYAYNDGIFTPHRWMKALVRDLNDPFSYIKNGTTGGLNIIDLANLHTCSFIETEDLGRMVDRKSFEVLGRIDNSEIRGCNLLVING